MLKLIVALLPLWAANVSGQMGKASTSGAPPAATQSKTVPSAAKSTPSGAIPGIPAGAVKIDDNTYRYTERDASGKPGKVWLFRRNPFGISKVEEKEAAKIGVALAPPETPAVVTDLGDSLRFERSGPFGAKIWTKKKSELTTEEKTLAEKSKVVTSVSLQKAAN